ncbi:MAG: chorismate synthase [Candidatus Lokiarchaeota archaeon]
MGDNTLGKYFTVTSFGESHGKVIGVVIDGVPAGLKIDLNFINYELKKRRPGQSKLTTSREEEDKIEFLSGIFNEFTTGAPICAIIKNKDFDSSGYEQYKKYIRPSHVDYPIYVKYRGFADYRGSGRFSGRVTAGFVIAGAIANQILRKYNIEIFAYTTRIGNIEDNSKYYFENLEKFRKIRESSPIRSINPESSNKMINLISKVKNEGDSIGGLVRCIVKNMPLGIGRPIFNRLESSLSNGIFSIPSIKGIGFGAGFKASQMKGSEHNDPWVIRNNQIKAEKNNSGGIIGGISTGMPIEFTVAVKPTPTIQQPQKTINLETMEEQKIIFQGRHDPCIVPRVVVIIESITAITLLDHLIIEGVVPHTLNDKAQ